MTRQKIVAGNWKMNGSSESINTLVEGLLEMGVPSSEVVVGPSFPYLSKVNELIFRSHIKLAAQNASVEVKGAYTGEVSVSMLNDFDVKYIFLGHSERRSLYGESDALVADKIKVALDFGFTPILCVGETLEERNTNQTFLVCERQIQAVLSLVGIASFRKMVVAYEPVWAIGTGLSATAEEVQEVHSFIRSLFAKMSEDVASKVQILYGGSVNASNSQALFKMPDVDGALVGGASLDAKEFIEIVKAAG